jgi:acyl-coenzyme A synthetase/AMP-(fatty) acid ligase
VAGIPSNGASVSRKESRQISRVKAAVVLRADSQTSREELLEWCRARLGGFQQPRSIELLNYLPRTTTGKVLKRELRDAHWTDQARRVGAA